MEEPKKRLAFWGSQNNTNLISNTALCTIQKEGKITKREQESQEKIERKREKERERERKREIERDRERKRERER